MFLFLTAFDSFPTFYAQEQIDPIAIRSVTLFKRETGVNRSRRSLQKSDWSNSLFFTSESLLCSQKMSDLLKKPMSEFPTLV